MKTAEVAPAPATTIDHITALRKERAKLLADLAKFETATIEVKRQFVNVGNRGLSTRINNFYHASKRMQRETRLRISEINDLIKILNMRHQEELHARAEARRRGEVE